MNNFDKEQIKLLQPLLTNDVVLHFSFYANTFPIAYHYNLLLTDFNKNKSSQKKEIPDLIKPHNWNEVFPSKSNSDFYKIRKVMKIDDWESPEAINLFYTSNIDFRTVDFQKDNPFKKIYQTQSIKDKKEMVKDFLFSEYTPRFVFLNNNLYTQKLTSPSKKNNYSKWLTIDDYEFKEIENIKPQYFSLTEILLKAKSDKIEHLCIYTETINEAKDIFEDYDWDKKKIRYYDENKIDSLELEEDAKNESKSLDIYFYGAPTSFLFHKRESRFIPVLLDKANLAIKTMAIIHSNFKEKKHSPEIINSIKETLEKYHQNIFKVARSKEGTEFLNNIRLAYNKYARLTRSDSYFFTPESFANCIALHHKYDPLETIIKEDEATPTSKQTSANNGKQNIHVHYGAGKLGTGLVLPLIKPNTNCNNQLIVIQKNRDEWYKKIRLDLKSITLSNTDKWNLSLELRKLSNTDQDLSADKDYFFLFDELKYTESILIMATSISYSLNNQEIEREFLEFISGLDFKNDILVFPFENKPFGVNKKLNGKEIEDAQKLNDLLKKKPLKGYTKLKADRICPKRSFDLENKVSVSCEDHIEVVLNIDENETNALFDISKNRKTQVIFAKDDILYQFLSDRKEFLVNELHFILVVYGYDFLLSKGIQQEWENQFVTIIQSALASDPMYKIPIDTFIRFQIVRLLLLYKDNKVIIRRQFGLLINEDNDEIIYEKLLEYAKAVIQRFNNSKEDHIERVFNTGDIGAIERKYNSIVKNVEKFVHEKKEDIEKLQIIGAGTSLEYEKLVEDIKNKIENIFHSKITNFNSQVASKKEEQIEKQLELESFDSKVKALTKKNENVLIVFDVDGTIFKAKEIFLPAIKAVLSENDITEFTDDDCMKFVGMPNAEFENKLQALKLKTSYKDFKLRLQQLELENILALGELFESVPETLYQLKAYGYTLAICTNARKEYLDTIITHFELKEFFAEENIMFPAKDENSQPATKQEMLNTLKSKLKPFKSFMVGDRFYDSEAALLSGFEFIGASYGYGKQEIAKQTNNLVDNFEDIISIIHK